jgi:putative transposase
MNATGRARLLPSLNKNMIERDPMKAPTIPDRRHPAHGVRNRLNEPIIVFLTVCTKHRAAWLATSINHALLREVWTQATGWLVGRYVIMPDHLHLFAAPGSLVIELDPWVRYWKSQFTKQHPEKGDRWQTDHWDSRLRSGESYDSKWEYVVQNPVRHGLVERAEDWPYQGELFHLPW